jgi:hypothetical protein
MLIRAAPLSAQSPGPGQNANRRTMTALRLDPEERINVDGRLDEDVWRRAEAATDFLQQDPSNGEPASERTEVRAAFDRGTLYLGVICFDSDPSRILGNQMQRDRPFDSDDRFMWSIDSYLDERTGYYFVVNPLGAMGDGLVIPQTGGSGGISVDQSWDGIWNARVNRNEQGWTIEVELPFRTINFDSQAPAWGINFQRTVKRSNEESLWTGYARNQGITRMNNAGRLTGLSDMTQGIGIEVKPYVVGALLSAPGRGVPDADGDVDAGLDLFYNVTPGLRANFTLNTDFAETEVDQRRVNLTRFPLFFPEKRDFFLEGSGFFDFSREPGNTIKPFFSRRIGLDPNGNPRPILYGAKLTGQTKGFHLGVLQVREREADTIRAGSTERLPAEDFTVARARRPLFTQSYIGGLYTHRIVHDLTAVGSVQPGSGADTAGIDFEMMTSRFRGSQNFGVNGFYVWTSNPKDAGRSAAYGLRVVYPNDLINARMSWRDVGENYDPAVGFIDRRGVRRFNPVFQLSPRPRRNRYIRRFVFGDDTEVLLDADERLVGRRHNLRVFQMDLHSGDGVTVMISPMVDYLEQRFEISTGITLPQGETHHFTRYQVTGTTGAQRRISGSTTFEWGTFYSGRSRDLTTSLTVLPRSGWSVNLQGEFTQAELAQGSFSTKLGRAFVNTQFSPWISLNNSLQYDNVSRNLGWQLRLRWIRRPGDDLYFVYTHNWVDLPTEPGGSVASSPGFATVDRRAAAKITKTWRF